MISRYLTTTVIFALGLTSSAANACRVACPEKEVFEYNEKLGQLIQVEGELKVLSQDLIGKSSDNIYRVAGVIVDTKGRKHDVFHFDTELILQTCCPEFVLPTGSSSGTFYLQPTVHEYRIMHWDSN